MRIDHIKINRYKSIKEPININTFTINILIGKNNCGKSNILNAIELALKPEKDSSVLFYEKSDIEIDFIFNDKELRFLGFKEKACKLILRNNKRELKFKYESIEYDIKTSQYVSGQVKRLDEFSFSDLGQIQKDFRSLFSYKDAIYKFERALRKHFPKVSADENAIETNYEVSGLFEGNRKATIDWLGLGFRRVFSILLYAHHPEFPIVMIDEPETHLHPALIKKLLWAMENSNESQIYFSTHSPLFINVNTLEHTIRVIKTNKSTKIVQLSGENYNYERLSHELNADNLEMFFADKVILVEGASDKILIRALIDKFYNKEKEIKVIQTYGKGNAGVYAKLLSLFKIPFSIVFDKDILRGGHLYELLNYLDIDMRTVPSRMFLEELKKHNIFVFPNGDLEANYPRKYQKDNSKSVNAFYASRYIGEKDFNSNAMRYLKELINNL